MLPWWPLRHLFNRFDWPEHEVVGGVECGVEVVDGLLRTVRTAAGVVRLSPIEWELLCLLMASSGVVVKREVLLVEVWGEGYGGDSRVLGVRIASLRRKLGSAAGCIRTVRGVGYCFGSG